MKKIIYTSAICLLAANINAHAGWLFDRDDNTAKPSPLVNIKQDIPLQKVWASSGGNGSQGYKMSPSLFGNNFYVADHNGQLSAYDKTSGKALWHVATKLPLTTTPGTDGHVVVVGSSDATVAAYTALDGKLLWTANLTNEVLAQPLVKDGRVWVKSIDDQLVSLDAKTGKEQWRYDNGAPALTLRVSSAVKAAGNKIIAGFSDGRIAAFNADTGNVIWKNVVAEPKGSSQVEQMVDISADPIIEGNVIYATSYQGNLTAIRLDNGQEIWKHALSSFSGMTLAKNVLYVSDASGEVWAFQAKDGVALWRQNQLAARGLSAPAVAGPCVIVGDKEGYVHVLSAADGHLRARTKVASKAIIAEPIVSGHSVYVLASQGALARYDLG